MQTNKPIILVSSYREPSLRGGGLMRDCIESSYANAVILAGGIPLVVSFGLSANDYSDLAFVASGLLLPGGGDIHPSLYGKEEDDTTDNVSEERDALEFSLVRCFLEKKKPIFGICRGAQVLNVAMGGNLYRDIASEVQNPIEHWTKKNISLAEQYNRDIHTIEIQNGSALAGFFKMNEATVNSLHHQAVKSVGGEIRAGAIAPDGVIEEVESSDMGNRWLLGVQWHPEAILDKHPENKTLFEGFIEAAKKSTIAS
jgi:putative glutamine amidotransferase